MHLGNRRRFEEPLHATAAPPVERSIMQPPRPGAAAVGRRQGLPQTPAKAPTPRYHPSTQAPSTPPALPPPAGTLSVAKVLSPPPPFPLFPPPTRCLPPSRSSQLAASAARARAVPRPAPLFLCLLLPHRPAVRPIPPPRQGPARSRGAGRWVARPCSLRLPRGRGAGFSSASPTPAHPLKHPAPAS